MTQIYYIVSGKDEEQFKKYLEPSLLNNFVKSSQIILALDKDFEGRNTIANKYNDSLDKIKGRLQDDDIVVFLHDDVTIHEELFEDKLKMYFSYKPNIGVAGVIGTTVFPEEGGWWMVDRTQLTRGKILQGHPEKPSYMMNDNPGMWDDIVSIDGCIMFMMGKIAKGYRFDNENYNGYHFYDCDCCFEILQSGYDVGVVDILVEHQSEGPLSEDWNISKEKFLNKWKNKGYKFPIKKEDFLTQNYK